jgi:2-oxoglutarate ferredoxin oxidoreductase subunit alpha
MQEGLSHLAGLELPAVIAVLSRGGPGLGNWHPSQGDYFPATRAGHGDGHPMVLAPGSVREMADFTQQAFNLADKYRNPVIVLADTLLSRLREPLEPFPPARPAARPVPDWALDGARSRPARALVSFLPDPLELQARNHKLVRKYDAISREETAWQTTNCQDALLAVVAFGGAARIAAEAVQLVRDMGMRVGLFRPQTVWPFPQKPLQELAHQVRCFLVVELNTGQMLQDVELALAGQAPVHFHGRPGGAAPTPAELAHQISRYYHRAGLHNGPDSGHQ